MAGPIKGDVVVALFPFSDLIQSKRRPALVLTTFLDQDILLCQITSQATGDPYAAELEPSDFTAGSLRLKSYIRPNRLFTAERSIVLYVAGHITQTKEQEVITNIIDILRQP